MSKVPLLCSSRSSQAAPACPPLPAWTPQGRPLSPADPTLCSPSSSWGHRSGSASAVRPLLSGTRIPPRRGRWRRAGGGPAFGRAAKAISRPSRRRGEIPEELLTRAPGGGRRRRPSCPGAERPVALPGTDPRRPARPAGVGFSPPCS